LKPRERAAQGPQEDRDHISIAITVAVVIGVAPHSKNKTGIEAVNSFILSCRPATIIMAAITGNLHSQDKWNFCLTSA
jgi:hypothetical protein